MKNYLKSLDEVLFLVGKGSFIFMVEVLGLLKTIILQLCSQDDNPKSTQSSSIGMGSTSDHYYDDPHHHDHHHDSDCDHD